MAMRSKDIKDAIRSPILTSRRVTPDDRRRPKLADWVTRLEEETAACAKPPDDFFVTLARAAAASFDLRSRLDHPKNIGAEQASGVQ